MSSNLSRKTQECQIHSIVYRVLRGGLIWSEGVYAVLRQSVRCWDLWSALCRPSSWVQGVGRWLCHNWIWLCCSHFFCCVPPLSPPCFGNLFQATCLGQDFWLCRRLLLERPIGKIGFFSRESDPSTENCTSGKLYRSRGFWCGAGSGPGRFSGAGCLHCMSGRWVKSGLLTLWEKDCFGSYHRRTLGEELRFDSCCRTTVGVACPHGSSGHQPAVRGSRHGSNDDRPGEGYYRCFLTVGGWCYYCWEDRRTFSGMSGHLLNHRMSSVARGSHDWGDLLQATHAGPCPRGKKAQEWEAPSSPHPDPAVVYHCVAWQEDWIGIWGDVEICDGEGTDCGALTDVVNGAFVERSGDGGVCPANGRADVHVGCPACSQRSLSGASSLANGASGGENHPCCTSYRLSSYYGVCSCPFCPVSHVCGCYGDGGSGGRACADLTHVSSCPHSGMFYEGLVESWNPMTGGADCQEVRRSLPKQFEPRRWRRCRRLEHTQGIVCKIKQKIRPTLPRVYFGFHTND